MAAGMHEHPWGQQPPVRGAAEEDERATSHGKVMGETGGERKTALLDHRRGRGRGREESNRGEEREADRGGREFVWKMYSWDT